MIEISSWLLNYFDMSLICCHSVTYSISLLVFQICSCYFLVFCNLVSGMSIGSDVQEEPAVMLFANKFDWKQKMGKPRVIAPSSNLFIVLKGNIL